MKLTDWYCVQVAAGCEKKAQAALLARRAVLQDPFIENVEVPEASELVFSKDGKRKVVKNKLLPGYILDPLLISPGNSPLSLLSLDHLYSSGPT